MLSCLEEEDNEEELHVSVALYKDEAWMSGEASCSVVAVA